ncbi:hydantoinase/oxoprolinase family protein [Halorubrum sp. SS7]|uniref:hydantoinase/oxoprolinase family protein n=2 Tax=unclassified Halorubrum TaxID=2642239 RepID=UPI0010F58F74|nr:hydantoinase/oxoprolinase family protein [Halorubrum sp. SS7]TKX57114.1 hydantoinase/oxoprolinase family protein [Halorubrum sp. SS7]
MTSDDVRIGVDIGGTFTDLVTVSDGTLDVTKTSSTPVAPEDGVKDGLENTREKTGVRFDDVDFFAHGTTVATNAVLEEDWADTALVTTDGFRDVLEIGRQARPDIYDFQTEKPATVVPRNHRYEIPERLDERGDVTTPLDEGVVRDIAAQLVDADISSVAISLLFSYENASHERRIKEILEAEGVDASFSLSSEVLPEIREYERTLTTALNAALKPVMDRYLGNLEREIADLGIRPDLEIMQSNGGIITADIARTRPVNTLLSGPAAGVQGASYVAGLAGIENLITMDMGGTSCDVSLVEGGDPMVATDVEVGEYPVNVPMIDIHTVGAGGGSIAWIDDGDALRVGPRSAGAEPGPICYGRGGTSPTITDAQLLLGRLNPDAFLSDELSVDVDRVEEIFEQELADPLGKSVEDAAQGVLDVANASMERALRVVSVERGYDPRDFGLVAFGGAGPLHATTLAAELDIPRVLIPRTAGVLSALGLLISDILYDYSTSRVRSWESVDPSSLQATFDEFVAQGREQLANENLDESQMRFERSVDLRYAGQSFELSVPVPDGTLDSQSKATIRDRFHTKHQQRYGHAYDDEPIELVTLRTRARGVVETPNLQHDAETGDVADAIIEERPVHFDGAVRDTRVYQREQLPAAGSFTGPAIVEGAESTVVVRPEQSVQVDEYGSLIVEVQS